MFPLIPVILLLLLQGPSNADRLARNGHLLGSLDAIAADSTLRESDRVVLASLFAREDAKLSDALIAILRSDRTRPSAPPPTEPVVKQVPVSAPKLRLQQGYARSQRSRDGPLSFVL